MAQPPTNIIICHSLDVTTTTPTNTYHFLLLVPTIAATIIFAAAHYVLIILYGCQWRSVGRQLVPLSLYCIRHTPTFSVEQHYGTNNVGRDALLCLHDVMDGVL